jgi:hypothetical protein
MAAGRKDEKKVQFDGNDATAGANRNGTRIIVAPETYRAGRECIDIFLWALLRRIFPRTLKI